MTRADARLRLLAAAVLSSAALLAVALSASASVAGGKVTLSSGCRTLSPGEAVTICWPSLPEGVGEFELLLRSESPVRQKLRLTEQLDPELRRFEWRVPDLPCTSARIVLRCGVEGRGEVTWGRSAPFQIAGADGSLRQSVRFAEGEWWICDSPPSGKAASLAGEAGPQLRGLPFLLAGAEPGSGFEVPTGGGAWRSRRGLPPVAPGLRALDRGEGTRPLKVPLRI